MATKAKQMVEDDDIFQTFEPIEFEEPKFKPQITEKMSDEEFDWTPFLYDDDWCF